MFGLWLAGCSGGSGSGTDTDTDIDTNGPDLALPDGINMEVASKQITLSWPMQEGVTYDLYWSTDPDLDPNVAASNSMEPNITSPLVLSDLSNDQNYFAYFTARVEGETLTSPRLDTRLAAPGVDGGYNSGGGVTTLVQSNDGRLFVGGLFRMTGHGYGPLQVLDDHLGYPRAHPQINYWVNAVAADGQGGYFIATGWPEQKIKRVTADGQMDPTFNVETNDDDLTMLVHGETLYVGGEFSELGGLVRENLAAVSLSGNLLGWAPNPGGDIHALLDHDDVLYIGGDFNNADIFGEGSRSNVAAFDLANNRALTDWAPEPSHEVNALALLGDHIVLGGGFSQVNGEARARLAMVDKDGNLNDVNLDFSSSVNALATQDGWLYVGGQFFTPQPRLLRMDASGTPDESWPDAIPANTVTSLLTTDNGVYAGGIFDTVNGESRYGLTRVDHLGAFADAIDGTDAANGRVHGLALTNNHIYVAGTFEGFGGNASARHIARIYRTGENSGELDTTWLPDVSNDTFVPTSVGVVDSIVVRDNLIYMTGGFTQFNGADSRGYTAAINISNGNLSDWTASLAGPSWAYGRALQYMPSEDGFLLAGTFDTVNGTETGRLALIQRSDASLDTTSNLGGSLMDLKQSTGANAIHLHQPTGNVCFGVTRHETDEILRVGVHCMDSMGNMLW